MAYAIREYGIPFHYIWFELHSSVRAIGIFLLGFATIHFYLFTQDGGKTWRQLFWDDEDDHLASDCHALQALNDDLLWVWSWRYLRVSHDGGHTWDAWDWECCAHGVIRQVEFQTETFGIISVYPGQGTITELTTLDGGKTWTPKLSP